MPRMKSAIPLPTRCSRPPWSIGAVRSRQYSPAATRSRASAPMAMIAWRDASAPTLTSARKTTASTTRIAAVTGGKRRMRRSKSMRRERSMSGVMRSGCSGAAAMSAALAGIEHDAQGHGDAPVERAPWICRQVEHVAVEQRELAVELAEDLVVRAPDEDEVGAEQAEEGAEDAPEQREHDRVLDRPRERVAARGRDVPALADDVMQVGLAQRRERFARRRHDRVRAGPDRDA